jgi:hypothetical protein
MEPTVILTYATMVFGAIVVVALALPFVLKPLAEHREEGHKQRMAEYQAAKEAAEAQERTALAARAGGASGS